MRQQRYQDNKEDWREMLEKRMRVKNSKIPMNECIPRRLYEIHCRNLILGVYDGNEGFIGIREKFGSEYLFTEFHYDQGAPFGTVDGQIDTGIDLPENIELANYGKSLDRDTMREVYFDKPVADGGRGWVFVDTDEPDENIRPALVQNEDLFNWLKEMERKFKG